jgi:transaldolase
VASARDLHQRLARPNAFVKIPGTPAGLHAVEEAIFHGVPVNVTLLFDREQYLGAVSAHQRGLQRRLDAGLPADVASVASVFISRWDTAIAGTGPDQLQGKLGVSIGAQVHAAHHGVLASQTQQALTAAGAPIQRLLFASTSTKDPSWPDTLYIEGLVAPGTITTVPEETLLAFADHGEVPSTLDPQAAVADEVLNQAHEAGIDLSALGARLQHEGTDAFVQAWSVLMSVLSETS